MFFLLPPPKLVYRGLGWWHKAILNHWIGRKAVYFLGWTKQISICFILKIYFYIFADLFIYIVYIMPCVTVCLLFLSQSTTLTYHPQKAISIEEPLLEPLEWEWHVWCSSKRAASGWALLKCFFFGKKVNIWRPKLPPKSPRKILLWEHIFVDPSPGCFLTMGKEDLIHYAIQSPDLLDGCSEFVWTNQCANLGILFWTPLSDVYLRSTPHPGCQSQMKV